MTTRETSREAYVFAETSGLLSARRLEVFRFCTHTGQEPPYNNRITRNDVSRAFNDMTTGTCRRLQELAVMGLMRYVGDKTDQRSNCRNDAYEVNPEPTLIAMAAGRAKLREIGSRLTHAKALARLVADLEIFVMPFVTPPQRTAMAACIDAAKTRRPYPAAFLERREQLQQQQQNEDQ